MNRYSVCHSLLLTAVLVFFCPIVSALPGLQKDLLDVIEGIRQRENIAAVGIAIVDGTDKMWAGGLGRVSHNSNTPVSARTVFRIGSITKSFTSLAILKLVEQGRLKLDDEMSRWVPRSLYTNPWHDHHQVKIAHLLEHTAGFRDLSAAEFDYNESEPRPLSHTLEQFKDSHHTAWPPGQHYSYSNLGAAYAGYIIEMASHQNYESYLAEHVFGPLRMQSSGFTLKEPLTLAKAYDRDGVTPMSYYWHMVYRPFGGINSTPMDMGLFVKMLINKGYLHGEQIFQASLIERMEIPETTLAAGSGLTYGYGLSNYQWQRNGIIFHGHGGDAHGYLSHFGYTRSNNSGYFVVITAFNHRALREIRDEIESYLVKNVPPTRSPAHFELEKARRDKIIGRYRSVTSRFNNNQYLMSIFDEGGTLYTQIGNNKKAELIPVNATHFRRQNETVATAAIVVADDGKTYFQNDTANFSKIDEMAIEK